MAAILFVLKGWTIFCRIRLCIYVDEIFNERKKFQRRDFDLCRYCTGLTNTILALLSRWRWRQSGFAFKWQSESNPSRKGQTISRQTQNRCRDAAFFFLPLSASQSAQSRSKSKSKSIDWDERARVIKFYFTEGAHTANANTPRRVMSDSCTHHHICIERERQYLLHF